MPEERVAAVLEAECGRIVAQAPSAVGQGQDRRGWASGSGTRLAGSHFFGQAERGDDELGKQRLDVEVVHVNGPPRTVL